jgi:hypothetical protein
MCPQALQLPVEARHGTQEGTQEEPVAMRLDRVEPLLGVGAAEVEAFDEAFLALIQSCTAQDGQSPRPALEPLTRLGRLVAAAQRALVPDYLSGFLHACDLVARRFAIMSPRVEAGAATPAARMADLLRALHQWILREGRYAFLAYQPMAGGAGPPANGNVDAGDHVLCQVCGTRPAAHRRISESFGEPGGGGAYTRLWWICAECCLLGVDPRGGRFLPVVLGRYRAPRNDRLSGGKAGLA